MKNKKDNFGNKTALVWKMAIASALSWELAKLVGSHHPYLAPLSVVLCLQNTIDQSIKHSIHRIAGTAIAIILTAYIVNYLDMNGWMLGLLILGGTLIVMGLRFDATVIQQTALTIVLVFTFEQKSKDYAIDRIVDTIIGAAIAIIVQMFLFPPDFTKKAAASLQQLSQQLSKIFLELSNWLQSESNQGKRNLMEYKINLFLQELHHAKDTLNTAAKSLKFNPFSKKHKIFLSVYQKELAKISKGYQYVSLIIETLKEWEKQGEWPANDRMEAANYLRALGGFFGNPLVLHQNELKKENETLLSGLQDLLHSSKLLNLQPGYEVYRDSFCLETKRLLKSLTMNDGEDFV